VVAAFQPNGVASFRRLKREIPNHVRLSDLDTTASIMRPNEELWVQKFGTSEFTVTGHWIKMSRSLAPVQRTGNIKSHPILGGLHHHYVLV
jgi:hypothetical protein